MCICVDVCEREREKEKERDKEIEREKGGLSCEFKKSKLFLILLRYIFEE